MDEFLYGKVRENTKVDTEFSESVLASKEYELLVKNLINEHVQANANPDEIPLTYTSKVFDPATSYLWWGGKKNRFDEFNSTEKEMLKQNNIGIAVINLMILGLVQALMAKLFCMMYDDHISNLKDHEIILD